CDIKTGSRELVAWCWLYYRYVRVDFDISTTSFCRIAGINERTLLRYSNYGIHQLVVRLIKHEQVARTIHRKRHLFSQIPSIGPKILFVRDAELQFVRKSLRCLPIPPIQVIGADGVGKTAFIQRTVRALIEQGEIEFLLWLDAPTSIDIVYRYITEFL